MAKNLTEDAVRDLARDILGLVDSDIARAGVGQLTTFNQLGFAGVADKPDGWYLPKNKADVALVLETKATRIALGNAQVDEVLKNVRIVQTQYEKVVGVLYNGEDVRVFKAEEEVKTPDKLQHVGYYLSLYTVDSIDKERIYQLTARINNCLHFEFGIKNLYHRMIFTACALVAERYGAGLKRLKDLGYETFHTAIHSTLAKSLIASRKQNAKIDILLEEYSDIKMNTTDNQKAINDFIDWVVEISECINSNEWRGEDVMGIFFNEFNRYKKKSESGQIFTPEHITDFMYKILEVNMDDCILDATCGSGGFLVKAMANMIREAGGMETKKAGEIKSKQLYGIEFDREIYALACANMLIHKDGKTNLETDGRPHGCSQRMDAVQADYEGADEPAVREQVRLHDHRRERAGQRSHAYPVRVHPAGQEAGEGIEGADEAHSEEQPPAQGHQAAGRLVLRRGRDHEHLRVRGGCRAGWQGIFRLLYGVRWVGDSQEQGTP